MSSGEEQRRSVPQSVHRGGGAQAARLPGQSDHQPEAEVRALDQLVHPRGVLGLRVGAPLVGRLPRQQPRLAGSVRRGADARSRERRGHRDRASLPPPGRPQTLLPPPLLPQRRPRPQRTPGQQALPPLQHRKVSTQIYSTLQNYKEIYSCV